MQQHAFGRGEYKYFSYPLPDIVAALRGSLYPALAEVANRWNAQMGIDQRFPADHAAYLERCHAAGQAKPTPLLATGPLRITGADAEGEARVIELPGHPFFIGTLFVPQARSTPERPHPLVTAFVAAAAATRK